jgi:solute carrier family 35 protein F1/2
MTDKVGPVEQVAVQPKGETATGSQDGTRSSSTTNTPLHGVVHLVGADPEEQAPIQTTAAELERQHGGKFSYFKRPQFWIVLVLSQILSLTIMGTSTISQLLATREGWSIASFQSLLAYILLNLIYSGITLYKYGIKGWFRLVLKDGWKYFILAFFDVQGNFFAVSAFQYTNLLSTQLISFWAIATVMLVSFFFLKVRYHVAQIVGILICCGGLGVLIASDRLRGASPDEAPNPLKGDLFALAGATAYGLSNVIQEFLVSKRPMYEVIGQLAFWGQFIIGVQGAIFNRDDYANATWSPQVGGYLIGYTLLLTWFYTGAPIVFRMASAAFFNIGLLTANFWLLLVGTAVFGYTVHFLYPVAFVLIMLGHFVYYGTEGVLGEAKKPWLGENQEGGDDGIGTARRKLQNPNVTV